MDCDAYATSSCSIKGSTDSNLTFYRLMNDPNTDWLRPNMRRETHLMAVHELIVLREKLIGMQPTSVKTLVYMAADKTTTHTHILSFLTTP